jgi:ribonuclease BN (tRNA processing enzyme)
MKLTFLGVSSALSEGYNSNMLLDIGDKTFLIDCGEDIKHSLKAAGRSPEEIDGVYISHLHSDHCFGLSWLGYYNYFILKRKISLYIHESLVNDLWCILSPAMNKMKNEVSFKTLNDYFDITPIPDGYKIFLYQGILFQLIKNKHISSFVGNMYSYGLLVEDEINKKHIYISSDTESVPPGEVWTFCSDLVFHDVDVMNLGGVHCDYNRLKTLPDDIKEKMWLYHYCDLKDKMPDAKADGFAGFVKEGQIFEIE